MEEYMKTLKMAAYLLEYPDMAWWEDFADSRKALEELEMPQARAVFRDFFDYVESLGAKEYEAQYVRSFDFSQNTNLYLTTQERTDFGKQSNEMHKYKEIFLANGYDLDKELPDYLPAVLELAGSLPKEKAGEVLSLARGKIELLRDRFIEAKLAQAFLLDVVLTTANGLEGSAA